MVNILAETGLKRPSIDELLMEEAEMNETLFEYITWLEEKVSECLSV